MPRFEQVLFHAIAVALFTASAWSQQGWNIAGIRVGESWIKIATTLRGNYIKLAPVAGLDSYFLKKGAVTVMVLNDEVCTLGGTVLQDGKRTLRAGDPISRLCYLGHSRDHDENYVVYTRSGVRLLIRTRRAKIVEFTLERG